MSIHRTSLSKRKPAKTQAGLSVTKLANPALHTSRPLVAVVNTHKTVRNTGHRVYQDQDKITLRTTIWAKGRDIRQRVAGWPY